MTTKSRLVALETQVTDLHNDVHDTNAGLLRLEAKFEQHGQRIEEKLDRLGRRPSWGVTFALVTLSSVAVALIGALAALATR